MTLSRANEILQGTGIKVVTAMDYEGFYPRRRYHWEDDTSSSDDYRTVKQATGEAVKYFLTKIGGDYERIANRSGKKSL